MATSAWRSSLLNGFGGGGFGQNSPNPLESIYTEDAPDPASLVPDDNGHVPTGGKLFQAGPGGPALPAPSAGVPWGLIIGGVVVAGVIWYVLRK